MKLRHYFRPLAAVALALLATQALAQEPPVVKPEEKIPEVQLPPMPVTEVAKFSGIRARELPWHVRAVKAPEAWAKNPAAKGKGLKIAILDTWGQADHPGLDGMVKGQYDAMTKRLDPPAPAKPHNHGTHVAGIVHSIAPEAELYLITVLDTAGRGRVDHIAHGIDYAVTEFKVDVVCMSLGGPVQDSYLPPALRRAVAAGVIPICAAGNDSGGPGRDTEGYPGRYPEAVSVAASDKNDRLAAFSSWGPNVFTVDPGVDILSLLPDTREGLMSGTSMAAPVEVGKCASWIASNAIPKDVNRVEKYRRAVLSASPFKQRDNARGYGLYPIDKLTGQSPQPPGPVVGQPVTVTLSDLPADVQAKLRAQGITTLSLTLGGPGSGPALPALTPSVTGHPEIPPAVQIRGVGPTYSGEFQPPPLAPAVYQHFQHQQCGPGGCGQAHQPPKYQPAPAWVPGQRIRHLFR